MRNAWRAWCEWRALRRRWFDERDFHIERAAAELMELGVPAREAVRRARARFGRDGRTALCELGGDLAGLRELLHANQADIYPAWTLTLALVALGLLSPIAAVETVLGRHLHSDDHEAVFVSTRARNLAFSGLDDGQFQQLRAAVPSARRYERKHARARTRATEAELRRATGIAGLSVIPLFERASVPAGYPRLAWLLAGVVAALVVRNARAMVIFALHAILSLLLWANAYLLWQTVAWPSSGLGALCLALLTLGWLCLAALQVFLWRRDLRRRCPRCLSRLKLPLEQGRLGNVLLAPPTCERICIHGHGAFVQAALLVIALPLQGQNMEKAVDQHFREWTQSKRSPGAAFAALDKGVVIHTAYFGASRPDSLWRTASTTKTITAIAVDRLGLSADLHHLLNHTAGYDDRFVNSAFLASAGPQPPISEVMRRFAPARLYPEGCHRLYTNAGYGLIGAFLEQRTQRRYEEIIQTEVFDQLGLVEGTLQQPLDAQRRARVVPMQERTVFGRIQPAPILYHRYTPASAWTTTLEDLVKLARFVQTQPDARQRFALASGVSGGHAYWYAGGDLGGHHTSLVWFPDHQKALVAVASSHSPLVTAGVIPRVRDAWLPKAGTNGGEGPPFRARQAGTYRPVRYPHHDLGKTFTITMEKSVAADPVAPAAVRNWEKLAWYETGRAAVAIYAISLLTAIVVAIRGRGTLRWLGAVYLVHGVGWLGAVLWHDPQRLILGHPAVLEFFLWWGVAMIPAVTLYHAVRSRGWLALGPAAGYLWFLLYWRIWPQGF